MLLLVLCVGAVEGDGSALNADRLVVLRALSAVPCKLVVLRTVGVRGQWDALPEPEELSVRAVGIEDATR